MPDWANEVSLTYLRYFVAVVEGGGFHAAAERLGRSQPAISQAIRSLEDELGGTLFERGTRGYLTPLGRSFYPMAAELLESSGRLMRTAQQMAAGQAGRVAVAAVPSVASRLLPEAVGSFMAAHAGSQLTLYDEPAGTVQRRVREGHIDVGIASLENRDSELAFEPLFHDPLVLVCARDHPLAAAEEPVAWESVLSYALIDNGTTRLIPEPDKRAAFEQARYAVPHIFSLLSMVEVGLGLTTLPRLAVPDHRRNLTVKALALEQPTSRQVGLIAAARRPMTPLAGAFYAHMRAHLPPLAAPYAV